MDIALAEDGVQVVVGVDVGDAVGIAHDLHRALQARHGDGGVDLGQRATQEEVSASGYQDEEGQDDAKNGE